MNTTYPRPLNHVALSVDDIEAAKTWYRDVLGFQVLAEPSEIIVNESPSGALFTSFFGSALKRLKICYLTSGNGVGFELFEFIDPPARRPSDDFEYTRTGFFHICVTDPDVDGLTQKIVDAGGRRINDQVQHVYPGTIYRGVYCHDPFGNVVEVLSRSYEQQASNRDPDATRA